MPVSLWLRLIPAWFYHIIRRVYLLKSTKTADMENRVVKNIRTEDSEPCGKEHQSNGLSPNNETVLLNHSCTSWIQMQCSGRWIVWSSRGRGKGSWRWAPEGPVSEMRIRLLATLKVRLFESLNLYLRDQLVGDFFAEELICLTVLLVDVQLPH